MNILSIDANNWVAQGLSALMTSQHDQVLTCVSISDARRILTYQCVDILVVELKTEEDNIEAIYDFLRLTQILYPQIRVVIFTEITDAALLNFFVNTLSSITLLKKSSSLASIKRFFILPMESVTKTPRRNAVASLSPQEFKMLKWFSQYSSQQEIAFKLRLNNKTISHYKRSIYTKLYCKNNVHFHDCLKRYGFNSMD
ncbi:helix-turn-helix transcriptional regulator [Candidatus Pantoea formicae]|uniref:helix-turn-helix transcriptional regulator n=1 Tax=Candidatus Pantoea formicae TaxID=2608355 RepID=UPI003EDA380F